MHSDFHNLHRFSPDIYLFFFFDLQTIAMFCDLFVKEYKNLCKQWSRQITPIKKCLLIV